MWDQLIFPARERPVYGPPPSPAGWGDRGLGKVLFDDLPDIEPEPEAEPPQEAYPALEVVIPEPEPEPEPEPVSSQAICRCS